MTQIEMLQAELLKMPQAPGPVRHLFMPGIYIRELTMQPIKDPDLVVWLEKDIHGKVLEILKAKPDPTPEDLKQAVGRPVFSWM